MADVKTLIDLIGNTPIVQVKNMDTGPCNLFLKMEGMNPGSSIKDRVALNIIETAEREGKLKPGYTIIEASAGNTAMGLALIGKLKGYKAKVVILDKMNANKIFHLRAIGAEVIMTRSDVGTVQIHGNRRSRVILKVGGIFNKDFERRLVYQLQVGLKLSNRDIIGVFQRQVRGHFKIERTFLQQGDGPNAFKRIDNRGEPYIQTCRIIGPTITAALRDADRVTVQVV